jgi:hypothetical protein
VQHVRLTAEVLKKIVNEEMRRMREGFGKPRDPSSVKADEVDADELADALEKHVDHAKALKMEESRLTRRLQSVKEQRRRLAQRVLGRGR